MVTNQQPPQKGRTAWLALMIAQVAGAISIIILGINGIAPAWVAWTVGIIFAASFVVPELLGPLPIIVCLAALIYALIVLGTLAF